MELWFSYSLTDFLLFSADSYDRLFVLANLELWPAHLLLLAVASSLLWTQFHPRPKSPNWITLVLATFWTVTSLLFLHRHYAPINPLVDWFALAFLAQALGFFVCHLSEIWRLRLFALGNVTWRQPGVLLVVYAIVGHPLVGVIAGRNWQGVEIAGIAPDATALITIGVLLAGSLKVNWLFLLLPLVWITFSAMTYLAMDRIIGLLPLVLAIVACLATVVDRQVSAKKLPP